jgi:hypothetical protein
MTLNEETATNVGPSAIEIAYERRGNLTDPVVLLIMGGAAQLVHWPEGFLAALLCRGLQVIRFDNRDVGRSTHFHDAPKPDVRAALAGDLSSAAYTLSDMAADTVGLLDALELDAAHVVSLDRCQRWSRSQPQPSPARSSCSSRGLGHNLRSHFGPLRRSSPSRCAVAKR